MKDRVSDNSDGCSRCLLDPEVPGVNVAENGLCSVCSSWDRDWGDWEKEKTGREQDLINLFEKAKKKNRLYDVLVPLSGGKDSTYALYVCRKKYGLRCLAVTCDNGFLTEAARRNAETAASKLGVDHVLFTLNRQLMIKLYRYFFLKTGFFCPVCMRGMQSAVSKIQSAFRIPLAISGTSTRTEEHVSWQYFLSDNFDFVENVLKGSELESEGRFLIEPDGFLRSPRQIKLPAYIDWDYDEIYRTIHDELGWRAERPDAEHMDCDLEKTVAYIRYAKFPALVPERLRFSKMATAGILTREEASRRVQWEGAGEPGNMMEILSALSITREEFEEKMKEPMSHKPFLKKKSRLRRRIRSNIRKLFP